MNTTELIGYYSSLQGNRAFLNEDSSVIVFGNKKAKKNNIVRQTGFMFRP
jgi:hypothetical protein